MHRQRADGTGPEEGQVLKRELTEVYEKNRELNAFLARHAQTMNLQPMKESEVTGGLGTSSSDFRPSRVRNGLAYQYMKSLAANVAALGYIAASAWLSYLFGEYLLPPVERSAYIMRAFLVLASVLTALRSLQLIWRATE